MYSVTFAEGKFCGKLLCPCNLAKETGAPVTQCCRCWEVAHCDLQGLIIQAWSSCRDWCSTLCESAGSYHEDVISTTVIVFISEKNILVIVRIFQQQVL